MLRFSDGQIFASGSCPYRAAPASENDMTHRIFLTVQFDGFQTEAVLDTGGVYFIVHPELAEGLALDHGNALYVGDMGIRGFKYRGYIHRLNLTLLATNGTSLEIEATAFIPELTQSQIWALPSFLGLFGCLERMRFAVDPGTDTFFFGSLAVENSSS
jgi:hypothetical protein